MARAAIADYLRRTRGVLADPRHIVVCSGATQAVALLGQTLRTTPLAMEDPGFWLHRMVLQHNGIEPIPVPVDDDGLDVDALASSRRDGGADHSGPSVADGRCAVGRTTNRVDGVGPRRPSDHRGRLRRRIPLRPCTCRVAAGHRARPGGVCGLDEQDVGPRPAHRLDGVARAPRQGGRVVERPCRHREFGDGSGGLRAVPGVGRIRQAPAADAQALPGPPKRAAACAGTASARGDGARRGGGRPSHRPFSRRLPVEELVDHAARGCGCGSSRLPRATPNLPRRHRV